MSSRWAWGVSGRTDSGGKGLASVPVVVDVGVGVVTGFRVVPVAAVVSVRGCQCVVLRGGSICVESLHRRRSFGGKIVLSVKKKKIFMLDVRICDGYVTLSYTYLNPHILALHFCLFENFHRKKV